MNFIAALKLMPVAAQALSSPRFRQARAASALRMPLNIAAVVLTCLTATASNWYVDGRAKGANNGTSWLDAWTNVTAIAWAGVQPGDTVWLSGGANGQTYVGRLDISKDGEETKPITIRVAQ